MSQFFVGAATAAHQVEGNNTKCDYWAMEHMPHNNFAEPSLDGVDHYHRYKEDILLLKKAGLNAYRFSIEWARIEPEEGKFDYKEVAHYREMIQFCRAEGITPIVTLHHFTSPVWVIKQGGWESETVISSFAKYCEFLAKELGEDLEYVCTINEANMRLQVAAIAERYKRQMMAKMAMMQKMAETTLQGDSMEGVAQVGMNFNTMMENMKYQKMENIEFFGTPDPATFVSGCTPEGDLLVMKAHQAAKKAMKEVCPSLKIGLTLSLHDIQAAEGGEAMAEKEWEEEFTHYLPYIKEDDFFGLQNYTRSQIGENGILPVPEGAKITQMEYENYPEALKHVILRVHEEFKAAGVIMPIMVTENGIATADDTERQEFIIKATAGVKECIAKEIPVIGYMHWSLLDNFEWQKGYSMTFGLIAVNRSTMERFPKESLATLGKAFKE